SDGRLNRSCLFDVLLVVLVTAPRRRSDAARETGGAPDRWAYRLQGVLPLRPAIPGRVRGPGNRVRHSERALPPSAAAFIQLARPGAVRRLNGARHERRGAAP